MNAHTATTHAAIPPMPPVAAPESRPDTELIALGAKLDALCAYERASYEVIEHCETDEDATAIIDTAEAVCGGVVDRIMEIPATTLEGLLVKSRAVSWCHSGRTPDIERAVGFSGTTDMCLIASIIRDLDTMRRDAERLAAAV